MSSPMPPSLDVPREPFMAFVEDDISRKTLQDVAQDQAWDISRIFQGNVDFAVQTLQSHSTPSFLIVDLSSAPDPLDAVMMLAEVCDEGIHLIVLGVTNDVQLYRTLMDMGVDDYILKPFNADHLNQTIERILTAPTDYTDAPAPDTQGDVVSVIGLKGGCGASQFALNLAWHHAQQKKVALVDLDLYFGTLALSLDLEAGKGFREALENPSRMDSLFLERAMIQVSDRLHLLACETDIATPCHFDAHAIDLLIERLRTLYDVVILDIPRTLWPQACGVLTNAGRIAILSDLSLGGMRDCLRFTRYSKDQALDEDRMQFIATRAGENKERELSKAEFEKGIERTLSGIIPFDVKGFGSAEVEASPLLKASPKAKATQQLRPILEKLIPEAENTPQKPSFWQKLLKK